MILVAGIPSEGPTRLVIEALAARGAGYVVFDQRRHADAVLELTVANHREGGAISGFIQTAGAKVRLQDVRGIYLRMMDDDALLAAERPASNCAAAVRCRTLHRCIYSWAEMAPARVLNRASDMASNGSKPFQMQVARACGFDVPETLITNDPQEARTFIDDAWADGSEVIYKSISGVRSIVRTVQVDDLPRLDRVRWCPTQFQRRVEGTDLRVHVVGQRAFAVRIDSEAIDYRYAIREQLATPKMSCVELQPMVAARCVALAQALRLPLAGIDLRVTPDDSFVCFEANPSPAFSYYEEATGAPISQAIASYLAYESD